MISTLTVEIAMIRRFNGIANTILTNATGGIEGLHECDVLMVTPSGYATEVEIKISKSDLKADKHKLHGHISNYIKSFYFAVPEFLKEEALLEIPERAGLFIVDETGSYYWVKEPTINEKAIKWNQQQIINLWRLSSKRILKYKEKLLRLEDYQNENKRNNRSKP